MPTQKKPAQKSTNLVDQKKKAPKSLKVQDISPTGVSELDETKKVTKELVEGTPHQYNQNSQVTVNENNIPLDEDEEEEEKNNEDEKKVEKIEKASGSNKENQSEEDYFPEVLSARPNNNPKIKNNSNIGTVILIVIVLILALGIIYWYWQDYNKVKSVQSDQTKASSTNLTSEPIIDLGLVNSNANSVKENNSPTKEIETQLDQVQHEINNLEKESLNTPEPRLDFNVE